MIKNIWITEQRVTEEEGKYYPEIHVWSKSLFSEPVHIYGYRFMIWFDNYNDAWNVAQIANKEEIERQKHAVQCFIEAQRKNR